MRRSQHKRAAVLQSKYRFVTIPYNNRYRATGKIQPCDRLHLTFYNYAFNWKEEIKHNTQQL
jgi:hypothetical protein